MTTQQKWQNTPLETLCLALNDLGLITVESANVMLSEIVMKDGVPYYAPNPKLPSVLEKVVFTRDVVDKIEETALHLAEFMSSIDYEACPIRLVPNVFGKKKEREGESEREKETMDDSKERETGSEDEEEGETAGDDTKDDKEGEGETADDDTKESNEGEGETNDDAKIDKEKEKDK